MRTTTPIILLLLAACSRSSASAPELPSDAATTASAGGSGGATAPADAAGSEPNVPVTGNPGPGVLCGGAACTIEEKCCTAQPPTMPARCVALDEACERAFVACDGPEDCEGGSACCFGMDGSDPPSATCQPSCPATRIVLCHRDADCGAGSVCCAGQYPPFWGVAFRRCQPGLTCPETP